MQHAHSSETDTRTRQAEARPAGSVPSSVNARPGSPTCVLTRSVSCALPHTMQLRAGGSGLHVTSCRLLAGVSYRKVLRQAEVQPAGW